MKRALIITVILTALPLWASAQNYVVDNIFGRDSVAFTTGVKKERASAGFGAKKKRDTQKEIIDTVYVRNGESVRLKEVSKDSLRVFGLLMEEVSVVYGGKTYYTLASNLKFSEDNPDGAVNTLTARLKNHKDMDIHGKDRWLFSRWLIMAILVLGLIGVIMSLFVGKRGRALLVAAVLLLDAYIFLIGLDTVLWFLEPGLTGKWFSIIGAVIYVLFIGLTIRLLVSLFKEKEPGGIVFAVLLILIALPVWGLSYLIVFGAAMKLLFTYWWIGLVTIALIVLGSVPPMSEAESRNWVKNQQAAREKARRDQEARDYKERKEKERRNFEKSQNKLEF